MPPFIDRTFRVDTTGWAWETHWSDSEIISNVAQCWLILSARPVMSGRNAGTFVLIGFRRSRFGMHCSGSLSGWSIVANEMPPPKSEWGVEMAGRLREAIFASKVEWEVKTRNCQLHPQPNPIGPPKRLPVTRKPCR